MAFDYSQYGDVLVARQEKILTISLELARDPERIHRADAHLDVPYLGQCE